MQDYPFAAPTIDGGAETNISPEYRTDGEDDTALMGTGGLNDEAANRH
jgi:hypothetical protein